MSSTLLSQMGVEEPLRSYVQAKAEGKDVKRYSLNEVVSILLAKQCSILQVVEGLAFALTSKDNEERRRGTELLAELAYRLPVNFYTEPESNYIAGFFQDRLSDHHAIQPIVLYGILGIISFQHFPSSFVVPLLQEIYNEVHAQSLVQADRRNLYNIFDNLLKNYLSEIKEMGPDFVMGFIQVMDGEKDPRNLLFCFQIVSDIVKLLNFELFAEDLFEVVSCYFPIDFSPPTNSPDRISRQDLVLGLRHCLASTAKFAEFCLPLMSEKISSDILSAKVDALETLAACVLRYKASDLSDWYELLWKQISEESAVSCNSELLGPSTSALKNIALCLKSGNDLQPLKRLEDLAFELVALSLRNPMVKDLDMTSRLVKSVLVGNTYTFSLRVLRCVLDCLPSYKSDEERTSVFNGVKILIDGGHGSIEEKEQLLSENEMSVILSFGNAENPRLKVASIGLYTACVCNYKLHSDISRLFQMLLDSLWECSEDLFDSSLSYLLQLVAIFKTKALEYVIPVVKEKLQHTITQEIDVASNNVVKVFTSLFSNKETHRYAYSFLVECIERVKCSVDEDDYSQAEVINVVCVTSEAMEKLPRKREVSEVLHASLLVLSKSLLSSSFLSICSNFGPTLEQGLKDIVRTYIFISDDTFQFRLAEYIMELLKTQSPSYGEAHEVIVSMEVDGQLEPNNAAGKHDDCGKPLLNIADEIVIARIVEQAVVCIGPKAYPVFLDTLFKWYFCLLQRTINDGNFSTEGYPGALALPAILNKENSEEKVRAWYGKLNTLLKENIEDPNKPYVARKILAQFLVVLQKALIIKWHSFTESLIQETLAFLSCEAYLPLFVEAFGTILSSDGIFQKSNHFALKLMYKQRLCHHVLPKLFELYFQSAENEKSFVAVSLCHTFRNMPKYLLIKELSKVFPILAHALNSSDESVLLIALETLNDVIANNQEMLQQHVTSLLPRVLALVERNDSMVVRIRSLRVLRLFSGCPPHLIFPYRSDVMKKLKVKLDDKKRLVRKEAVMCRNDWCLALGGT